MNAIGREKAQFERRLGMAGLAVMLWVGVCAIFFVPPADLPLSACVFHSLTGHSCLTCGMTRSLHAIAHGDLGASVRYHLFGPVVFIGMLLCLGVLGAEAVSGGKIIARVCPERLRPVLATTAIAWMVYWVARLVTELRICDAVR